MPVTPSQASLAAKFLHCQDSLRASGAALDATARLFDSVQQEVSGDLALREGAIANDRLRVGAVIMATTSTAQAYVNALRPVPTAADLRSVARTSEVALGRRGAGDEQPTQEAQRHR